MNRRREQYEGADGLRPYPSNVLGIINGLAWVGLVIFVLAGLAAIFWGLTAETATSSYGRSSYGTSNNEKTAAIIAGNAMIVVGAVHWAFSRAAALVVDYLWKLQANVLAALR